MMTEMTRYKQQTDLDDDDATSVDSISARTQDLSAGTTRIRYHMGRHFWRSRSKLEKVLLVGWGILIIAVTVLLAVVHLQAVKPPVIFLHDHSFNTVQEKSDKIKLLDKAEFTFTPPPRIPPPTPHHTPCLTPFCVQIAATILERMNLTADPCEDFYSYACGGFVSKSVKPEGKPAWGTLNKLTSDNQVILRKALESPTISKSKAVEKAKTFYRSCIDVNDTIEQLGSKPLEELIQSLGGFSLYGSWSPKNYSLQSDVIASKVAHSSGALFSWGVAEDDKDSKKYVIQIDQGGMMLATRDYYLNKSEIAVKNAYVEYITKIGVLLGTKENKSRSVAEDIVEVESQFATFSLPDEERRDSEKTYHNMTFKTIKKIAPFLDWEGFINAAFMRVNQKIPPMQKVVVFAPSFLKHVSTYVTNLTSTRKGTIIFHNYMTWHAIKNYLGYLARPFRDSYSILEKAQVGISVGEEKWRDCVAETDSALGQALGAMYVKEAFSDEGRRTVEDMLEVIRKSFREGLAMVPWMDSGTRAAALDKADHLIQMIGYPDYILDPKALDKKFDEVQVTENAFFENNINILDYKIKEDLNKLFKLVNRTQWDMTPSTVNAYYSPTRNNIVLPAGILQPPLFSIQNPSSLNFGALGVVMGHELSHAFDDQGRKYDKDGNLKVWWGNDTSEKFLNKTKCMVDQYSEYSLLNEQLNGKLTLGENIADNGGLNASFRAYQRWSRTNANEVILPGLNLTSSQIFFLGFGQVWCSTMTKEAAHLEILRDSHVLPQFRVRGSLSNSMEFARAYQCKKGSKMNPDKKCTVW